MVDISPEGGKPAKTLKNKKFSPKFDDTKKAKESSQLLKSLLLMFFFISKCPVKSTTSYAMLDFESDI